MLALHRKWVEAAGAKVVPPRVAVPGAAVGGVEVSPTLSYAGEGLERVCRGQTYEEGTHVSYEHRMLLLVGGVWMGAHCWC